MSLSEKSIKNIIGRLSLLCVAAFFLLLILLIGEAKGFLISQDNLTNKLSPGINVSIIEEDFGSYDSFEKGNTYTKKVTVKNVKSTSCYVRVFAEIEDADTRAKAIIDFNTTDWSDKQSDGYYYYKHILKAGESTAPLFTSITAKETIINFKMICYSESVQSDGFETAADAFNAIK